MSFELSPLVKINEIDLTTTIQNVATSIAVSILRNTYRGVEAPKYDLATLADELIEKVGKPTNTANCYRDILTSLAYLKVGNKLYFTTTKATSATFAGSKAPSGNGISATAFTTANAYKLSDIINSDPDEFGSQTISNYDSAMIWLIAKERGAWGNRLRFAICDKAIQDLVIAQDASVTDWTTYSAFANVDKRLQSTEEFLLIIEEQKQNETSWTSRESFVFSFNETKTDDQGKNIFAENVINDESFYVRCNVNPTALNEIFTMATSAYQTFGGGQDDNGDSVSDADIMNAIDLFANPEEIDVNIFIDSDKSETVKQYFDSISRSRMDVITIQDCNYEHVVNNRGSETTDLINWRRGLGSYTVDNLNINSSYSALYGNWAEVYDKYNQKYRWIPVSGHVAASYALTDSVADPWYAPAGLNRGILENVRRLAWNPTKGQRDLLYYNGINPIAAFASKGKVIWGQKTMLDKPSAFNRVNVRRLFMILEKSISTAAVYYLFEPNTAFTRLSLVNMIDPFLRDVKAREGIYDYLIVCDDTNNTAERIDRNELWCDIYIKPVRAAEFIILNFIATKTGASFTEISALRAA